MTDREKRVWTLVGKLALVAIPAAISGFSSYAKARVEATAQSSAAYMTLKEAVEKLQKENELIASRMKTIQDAAVAKVESPRPADSIGIGAVGVLGRGGGTGQGYGSGSGRLGGAPKPPKSDAGTALALKRADAGTPVPVVVVEPLPPFTGKVEVQADTAMSDGDGLPDTLEQAVQQVERRKAKK